MKGGEKVKKRHKAKKTYENKKQCNVVTKTKNKKVEKKTGGRNKARAMSAPEDECCIMNDKN